MSADNHSNLDGFSKADLPAKTRSFWRLAGPGAILVGLAIGSGELIMWPKMTAQFGPGMTWAAVIGGLAMAVYCPLLLFLNLRYLPKAARPGPIHSIMIVLASGLYVTFVVYIVVEKIVA